MPRPVITHYRFAPRQLGKVLYPKDARLIAFAYLTHRMPGYWDDPEVR